MINYNPDVLSCLANLSNDEVFTPPEIANRMLDLLPKEIWSDSKVKFLDPFCKSGVFLREITKRLLDGLSEEIPDMQERLDHILHHQVYGMAITELTSLVSRRSLYCSKDASSGYSISRFDEDSGNIAFHEIPHTWNESTGKCIYCGASREVYERGEDKESHAYQFIHTDNPKELFNNMKFDVIIGNPPYQLNDGGGKGSSATPLYQLFVNQSKKLAPHYLIMIIPSRWFSGGKGLDVFREDMLTDNRIEVLVDYFNSSDCFPGVDLSGGVCYFKWNRDYRGDCKITNIRNKQTVEMKRPLLEKNSFSFVRFNQAIPILRKVRKFKEKSFEQLVSPRKPFGDIKPYKTNANNSLLKVYAYPENGFINQEQVKQNVKAIESYKVFIAKAYGERGDFPYLVIGKPFIGEKFSLCTETYLMIGPCASGAETENIISYMRTKFFRFFVLFKKNTQNAARGVYSFVPLQDFSHPWTDEMLYRKYNLSSDEIAFIESMIRPME